MPEVKLDDLTELQALCPDLSTDFVEVLGRKIQLKPLMLRSQVKLMQLLAPLIDDVNYDLLTNGTTGVISALTKLSESSETFAKVVVIVAEDAGVSLTEEDLLDSRDLNPDDVRRVALACIDKQLKIGVPVADFFTRLSETGAVILTANLATLNQINDIA
jgi:hypothetical protein